MDLDEVSFLARLLLSSPFALVLTCSLLSCTFPPSLAPARTFLLDHDPPAFVPPAHRPPSSILPRLSPLFFCARPPYFPSIAACVSSALVPRLRFFTFARHTHHSSVHIPTTPPFCFALLCSALLCSSVLFTSMHDANTLPSQTPTRRGPCSFPNTTSSSVKTTCDRGAHQVQHHSTSVTLCTNTRLKTNCSTTRITTRGLSFLGESAAHAGQGHTGGSKLSWVSGDLLPGYSFLVLFI
jgi:hypothetical protein